VSSINNKVTFLPFSTLPVQMWSSMDDNHTPYHHMDNVSLFPSFPPPLFSSKNFFDIRYEMIHFFFKDINNNSFYFHVRRITNGSIDTIKNSELSYANFLVLLI